MGRHISAKIAPKIYVNRIRNDYYRFRQDAFIIRHCSSLRLTYVQLYPRMKRNKITTISAPGMVVGARRSDSPG